MCFQGMAEGGGKKGGGKVKAITQARIPLMKSILLKKISVLKSAEHSTIPFLCFLLLPTLQLDNDDLLVRKLQRQQPWFNST